MSSPKILSLVTASAAGLAMLSCQSDTDQRFPVSSKTDQTVSEAPPARTVDKRNAALVRFVHAVPDATAVDLSANTMLVMTSIPYKTITPFQEILKDSVEFRIRPSGQHMAEPLAVESEGLSSGEHYTVVAFPDPDAAKAALRVFADDFTPPAAGKAKVRLINAAADLKEVDVSISGGDKPLFTGVDFKSTSKCADVNPVSGSLAIHREGEQTPVLEVPYLKLEAGRIYTIILVGKAAGSPKLEALTIEDRLGTARP